ncbi:MAG: hypothetical protein COA79_20990 [Planctomycetota bacterium]|nr:MAG: hypothetical protein COA79_20990 [Planctomycetota bacterium]
MNLLRIIPGYGAFIDPEDAIEYVIPGYGVLNASPLPVPYLSDAINSNIGTVTVTISLTTNLIVNLNDILYWFISTSATKPSKDDLKAGIGAVAFGKDITPSVGLMVFNASGLDITTTYYAHYLQTSDNGGSLILTSGSFTTLDPTDLFADASILNSLTSSEDTVMTAIVTTPNDPDYIITLFYYRVFGSAVWISGGQGLSVKNTINSFEITGLIEGKTYELFVIARDSNFKQSVPSQVLSVTVGTTQSEEELFLDNLKEILSQCSTFQSWTSTLNKTDAKTFIFKRWKDNPDGKYAMLDLENIIKEELEPSKAFMSLLLVDDDVEPETIRNSETELISFSEITGTITGELDKLSGINGNLIIKNIESSEKVTFGDSDYEDDELVKMANYIVETGV